MDNNSTCETQSSCCACKGGCGRKIIWIALIAIAVFIVYQLMPRESGQEQGEMLSVLLLCPDQSCAEEMTEIEIDKPKIKLQALAIDKLKNAESLAKAEADYLKEIVNKDWDCVITLSGDAEKECSKLKGKVAKFLHLKALDSTNLKQDESALKEHLKKAKQEVEKELKEI